MTAPSSPQISIGIVDQYRKVGSLDPTTMTVGLNAYIERGTEAAQQSQNIHSLNRLVTISEKLFMEMHMKKEVPISRWLVEPHMTNFLLQAFDSYDRHFYKAGVHTTHSAWSITDYGSGKDTFQYGGPYRVAAPMISFSSSVTQVDSPYWNLVSQQIIENSLYRHIITDVNQSMQKHTWSRTEQLYSLQARDYVQVVEDKAVVAAGNYLSEFGDGQHYYDCCYIQVGKAERPPAYVPASIKQLRPLGKKEVIPKPTLDLVSPWFTKLSLPYGNYIINAHNDVSITSMHQSIWNTAKVAIMSSADFIYEKAQKAIHMRALTEKREITTNSKITPKGVRRPIITLESEDIKTRAIDTHIDDRDTIKITNDAKAIIEIMKDGRIRITSGKSKADIEITSTNIIKITASKEVSVSAPKVSIKGSKIVNVNGGKEVNVNAPMVNMKGKTRLGQGGRPIARVGDRVRIGLAIGTIISGSSNHTAS